MKHRSEIDGLRAIAVIPVILFHAGLEPFSGGFVGVDIFFVISGYLITTILIEDIEKGRFSIADFYERRARRILPALFVVVLVSALVAATLFDGKIDTRRFGNSVIYVAVFCSNIFFWKTSNYFEPTAELEPLLHTWSLAVEEQFYVLFPVLLWLAWRCGKKSAIVAIVTVAAGSFALSEWWWRDDPAANFYLSTTRAWELLAGSIAAFVVRKRGVKASNFLSLIGLSAIALAVFVFDENTPFPSVYALVPVIGAVLLVLYAEEGTVVGSLLSGRLPVWIGLISYSAYLWHQPLFVFARLIKNQNLSLGLPLEKLGPATSISLIGLTILLAYLSWRFVEKPARNRRESTRGSWRANWIFGSLASISLLCAVGLVFVGQSRGDKTQHVSFSFTWGDDVRAHECLLQGDSETVHGIDCYGARDDVLLWGDSHAASLAIGMRTLLNERGVEFTQLTQSGCGPLLDLKVLVHRKTCNEINERILQYITTHRFRYIVLHGAWLHEHYPLTVDEVASKTSQILGELKQRSPTTKVIVVGAVPRWRNGPAGKKMEIAAGNILLSGDAYTMDEVNASLRTGALSGGAMYVDPKDALCSIDAAKVNCRIANYDGESDEYMYTYIDSGHLSRNGSIILADYVMPYLQ